jgi:arylsulfatase A-like enzyme
VPFIIMLPFVLDEGIEVDARIANIDMWPTLLDMLGLPPMKNVDGVSQLPLILEAGGASDVPTTEGLRRPIFSQIDRRWGNAKAEPDPLVSVTDEKARVFIPVGKPEEAEFYEIATDPMEQVNLAADRADDLAGYRALAEKYLADDQPPWGVAPGTVELEEMQLNQLKALGYKIEN